LTLVEQQLPGNNAKAKRELDYQPRSLLEKGLRETLTHEMQLLWMK